MAVEQGQLNDNAVMSQTFHEGIWDTFRHLLTLIVVGTVVDVDDWLLNVTHTVTQHIDGNHGGGITLRIILLDYILRILILRTEVLTETERLSVEPSLLQLNEHQLY